MEFDQIRNQLLKEIYSMDEENTLDDFYKRRFFDLVENVILFMMQGQDAFFGQFMLSVRR